MNHNDMIKMNYLVFWKNCRSNRKRCSKICGDCPFIDIIVKAENIKT